MFRKLIVFPVLFLFSFPACEQPTNTKDDSLTVLLWDAPQTQNPNQDYDSVTDSVLFNVFEPLVLLDKDLHLKPGLAVSWENPQPEVWRFHLRKGVHFHDGTPLTAEIVRQSFTHIKDAGYETSSFLRPVKDFVPVDNLTIDLITETSYVLPIKLPFLYVFVKKETGSFPFVGTGPYRVTVWEPPNDMQLQFYENYWGGMPEFKSVQFRSVPSAIKRWQMLAHGQADIIYSIASYMAQGPVERVQVFRRTGLAVYYLGFHLRKDESNPFQDLRVRKAIAFAINKPELVRKILQGYGSVPTQPVAPIVFGYHPDIAMPHYDLRSAQKLMEEANYANGFDSRFDFSESRVREAMFVKNQLEKIRIRLALNSMPRSSVYDLVEQGKSDLFLVGWDCSSGDAGEFYEFNLHTPDGTYGMGNYGRYSNPELDSICERHNQVLSDRERKKMLHRAAEIVIQDVPVIPVFMEDDLYALKDSLVFEPRAEGQIRIFDVKHKKD
ncbi:ABC transporter substrate-binding protein [bacterium]|nr:ABC transporter substrate-binding protein [bacterium]